MRKLFVKLLVLALCFSHFSVNIHASEEITALYVGGEDAMTTPVGDGWSFDKDTGVLTLNNAEIDGSYYYYEDGQYCLTSIYADGDLTIELIGDNYVEQEINSAPVTYTAYNAIRIASPNKLTIKGDGKLTAGVKFDEDAVNWEYLCYSSGIFCNADGGVDLTGLLKGSELNVYCGVSNVEAFYNCSAWNTSPTFTDDTIVVAYRDLEATNENQFGYNWNNNDAWFMKVMVDDAYLNSYGILTLYGNDEKSGDGWLWKDHVLQLLSEECEIKGVVFKDNVGYAKILLNDDAYLDVQEIYDGYEYACAIYSEVPLEIDSNDNYLYVYSDKYALYAEDDVSITGFTDFISTYHAMLIEGGDLSIKDADMYINGYVNLSQHYDDEGNYYECGDIIIEDSKIFNYDGMGSYGYVTINNSIIEQELFSTAIRGVNGIDIKDSDVTMSNAWSDSTAFSSKNYINIDNCNMDLTPTGYVVYMYNSDLSIPNITMTNMSTTPEVWTKGSAYNRAGEEYITILDEDGNMINELHTTALISSHTHDHGDWTSDDDITHSRVCECGDKITEDHTYGSWIKEETRIYRECSVCLNEQVIVINPDNSINMNIIDNAAGAIINSTDLELLKSILNEEELGRVAAGDDVSIYIESEDISDNVSVTEKDIIETILGDYIEGLYLDIDLFKEIGGTKTQVNETKDNITITIDIPEALQNHNEAIIRDYKIVRLHDYGNGNIESNILDPIFNPVDNTLSFNSSLFSTYVLIYRDTVIQGTITLNTNELTLTLGEDGMISASAEPAESFVTWTSSDDSIVSVYSIDHANNTCTIKTHKAGTAIITASSNYGVSATCKVIVEEAEKPLPFTDIHDYDWYKDYVAQAYNLGLMTGASDTLFKPTVKMNRGMVAIVLHRMEGAEDVEFENIFPDVKNGEYYAESVIWAKLKGVINGYGDGTFRPLRQVTREEMAQMIYNFAKYKNVDVSAEVDLSTFLDGNKVSSWHKDAMMWANANGLITGKYNGTKLDPQGTATRAECCKMLVEAYKTIYK